MSSDSSNRYQSKLFNFVYQQSRKLTQKWGSTVKNLQVATGSGVGSLLYPLYQLWQQNGTTKQLQSATPPTSDAPIQVILDVVKNLPPGDADLPNSPKTNTFGFLGSLWEKIFPKQNSPTPENTLQQHIPTVQGIAIELQTRNLVLVSADNRTFDVFTPQQNAKLVDRINSEVSEHRYSLQLIAHQQPELLPKIDSLLNKLTDEDSIITKKSLLNPIKFFGLLDKLVANLETTTLVPIQKRSQEVIHNFTVNQDDLEFQKPRISDLITAAINHFFGGRSNYQISGNSSVQKLSSKSTPQQDFTAKNQLNSSDFVGDTWLTWDDLFGETITNTNQPNSAFTDIPEKSVDNNVNNSQPPRLRWGLLRTPSQIGQERPQIENEEFPEIDSQTKQEFNFKPDWIDISATSLGYEKHILEQILEWLDKSILWIEQIFTNMVYFFKGLLFGG
jgi:hypothetical protein